MQPPFLAEREGFEPPEPFSSTVFKTAVIDHSTTSPIPFGIANVNNIFNIAIKYFLNVVLFHFYSLYVQYRSIKYGGMLFVPLPVCSKQHAVMNMRDGKIDEQIVELAPSLKRYAYSLTSDIDDAEDLFQETCCRALSNLDKFDLSTNLKAWLFTIMKNTFINDYRKRMRRQTLFSKDVQEYVLNSRPAECGPESDFGYGEIVGHINSLEPEFRIPFQMHEDGYKYQEIAEELGLKLGTVKSRIHFSKQKLIDRLQD